MLDFNLEVNKIKLDFYWVELPVAKKILDEHIGSARARAKFDDLIRRLDHHAAILRQLSSDFYRTMILSNAGAIITTLSIVTNFQTRTVAIPPHVSGSGKAILISLLIGLGLSVAGYIILFFQSRITTIELRKKLDENLYGESDPEKILLDQKGWSSTTYIVLNMTIMICFCYSIVRAIIIVYKSF